MHSVTPRWMRGSVGLALLCMLGAPVARAETIAAARRKGAPAIKEGQQVAYYVWTDGTTVHVRWTSDGHPTVFSGSLQANGVLDPVVRTEANEGGWVRRVEPDANRVIFSTTTNNLVDGFDVSGQKGTSIELDCQIEFNPATVEQVFLGDKADHPKSFPLRFTL